LKSDKFLYLGFCASGARKEEHGSGGIETFRRLAEKVLIPSVSLLNRLKPYTNRPSLLKN